MRGGVALPREAGRGATVRVLQMSRRLLAGGGERRGRAPQREQPTQAHVKAGRREEPRWCAVCRGQGAGGGEAEWGALSGVEVTPGPGNQSPKRSCAGSCRCAGGRTWGLFQRCGGCDEAEGLLVLPSGPRAAASGRRWRPFSPGDQRSHLPGSHLQGRRRILRGVRAWQGPHCHSSKERRTSSLGPFHPLSRLAPKPLCL